MVPHPVQGPPEDPGIAPRALQSLFQEMGTGGQHRVTLSMVEIYNEAVRSEPCYSAFSSPVLFRSRGNLGNQALPFLIRDLLAPGPPERLAVRQGPAGQGGIQVAGLTYWDVPNLETLHQVRLPSGNAPPPPPTSQQPSEAPPVLPPMDADPAAGRSCRSALQMLSLGRSNRATAATSKNRHSSRSHALVTLTLRAASPPRGPGTAGTEARTRAPRVVGAHSTRDQGSLHVGLARPRRHAASGGPGGIRACLEGGGQPARRGETETAPSVCGRPGPSIARCWPWGA